MINDDGLILPRSTMEGSVVPDDDPEVIVGMERLAQLRALEGDVDELSVPRV